jgi:transposase
VATANSIPPPPRPLPPLSCVSFRVSCPPLAQLGRVVLPPTPASCGQGRMSSDMIREHYRAPPDIAANGLSYRLPSPLCPSPKHPNNTMLLQKPKPELLCCTDFAIWHRREQQATTFGRVFEHGAHVNPDYTKLPRPYSLDKLFSCRAGRVEEG